MMGLTPLSPKTPIEAGLIFAGPILSEIKPITENPKLPNNEENNISPSQAQPINSLVVSAINNFEKSIIEFAKQLCGKDFNEIESASKAAQEQIALISSIQNPEDYDIKAETIKSLQTLSQDFLDHFSDYNDPNNQFYQGSYLGWAAIIQITQEIEKLTQVTTKINFSKVITEEQSREAAMQVFIHDPQAIKLQDPPKQEIIDARDGIKAGLGTSSLALSRLQATLVSPAGTDLIGEIIGDIKTGDLFINKLMYASDLQGGSSYLTDNLQEFELKYHDNMALRHIQTETPNRRIYVKIPINLDQIKEGETLVLPTKLGYTAIATNAKYVKAMKDSLGLTYIYGLETESLEQDSQGQKYISYVLEGDRHLSTVKAPDNLDKWLELPTEKRLLNKYPHLKNVLDLMPNPVEKVELIEAFIALQQTYVDDPNLALALSSAPNMLDLQNELGFIGTCQDFAYCTDLILKEAEIPTIQASGLVAIKNRLQTSFDANQAHVINLVVQSGKIKEKDFTKNAKQKSNDSSADILIQELSTRIQTASHFAKQLGGDIEGNFRHICSFPEFNKLGQKIGIENKGIQFTFLTNSWSSIVSGLKDLDYYPPDSVTLRQLTNPNFSFDGDFAHAITDLAKANSPLKKLLEDPNRAKELIDFMSTKYAIKSKEEYLLNIFDLSVDELQTIIPALKDIEKNNFDTWLSFMIRDTLKRKIYTEAELKALIEHIETVIELINQETRHNFKSQTAYDSPDSIMCINLAKFSLDQTQITTLLQDLCSNSQVIFFDANGDIDPLSAPNLFLEQYPFDPNSKPMQAAHLGKLVNEPEKLTTIKDNNLLDDLANSSVPSFAGRLVAGLALDLSQTNLATLLEVLQKLPLVQSDRYYQGAKAIFEKHPQIHQRYLNEFNRNIQDPTGHASLILNIILPIYGSAQANLWMSVTNAFKNSSLESLSRDDFKEELLQHLESLNLPDQEKNTIKESILQLHDDLILFFGEYIQNPDLQKKPVPIRFSNTQNSDLIFLNPNPSLINLLGLDPDTYRKLSLGPASESFPEIRKLIANLGKAAYLKDSRKTIVISEAPKIGSTPDAYSVEMRDYIPGDPLNAIAHRASARTGKTLVRSSNQTIDTGKPIHHYIVDLSFLEDSSAMQSLLKELEEKLHHKDHRNIRCNTKIELKFTLTLDGTIITSMDHNTLANAFSRIKHLKKGFGLRSNLEAFIAELKLLAEKRPQLIPDRLIKGVALSGDSQINFLSQERAIQSKHKNLAYFVVSGNQSFADNFQNSLNSISRIKANWLRS